MKCNYCKILEGKYKLKNGKYCCKQSYQACSSNKVIPWNKNKKNVYSEETLEKMSIIKKGKKVSIETKQKIRKSIKGKKLTKEHKQKISNSLKGFPKTKEHKQKISKSQKGIPRKKHTEKTKKIISENHMGKNNPFYGKHHTKETKEKIARFEDKNPNWRGGISKEPYSFSFSKKLKEKIKKRDGYKCKQCNNSLLLCIHHINYNKENCDENNLITLCRSCHSKTNFNRIYWENYMIRRFVVK